MYDDEGSYGYEPPMYPVASIGCWVHYVIAVLKFSVGILMLVGCMLIVASLSMIN